MATDGIMTCLQKEMGLLQHELSQLDSKMEVKLDAKLDARFKDFREDFKGEICSEVVRYTSTKVSTQGHSSYVYSNRWRSFRYFFSYWRDYSMGRLFQLQCPRFDGTNFCSW
ncbi:hypothetical protein E1A91_D06G179000v1 [Gossypium mustelinum]|uniref:Uncharacterized protein n=1 Tax=Gossypium mustelinum TaxID=34275 RepID=A0A5D2UMM3_GOSMU|nr:hypothetical protein E1A91_D06G179000v1 [Gossypium mustelinum]